MRTQLHSIEHAPTNVPYWRTLMDDLCNPPPERVAKVLGKSRRSIQRYNLSGFAPRSVCLAVFWLTSWGRNAVHTQAHNDAVMMVGLANSLRSERDALRIEVRQLRTRCERLKLDTQRLRCELRAEIERPRRKRASWSEAQIERPESQIETEWKVLLRHADPIDEHQTEADFASGVAFRNTMEGVTRHLPPESEPEPTRRVRRIGARVGKRTQADPSSGSQAPRTTDPDCAGLDAGCAAFGRMFGALADRPASWFGKHESDVVDVPTCEPVAKTTAAPKSLPLADLNDARAGTPPSATALRASKAPRRFDPLTTHPWRRASAEKA